MAAKSSRAIASRPETRTSHRLEPTRLRGDDASRRRSRLLASVSNPRRRGARSAATFAACAWVTSGSLPVRRTAFRFDAERRDEEERRPASSSGPRRRCDASSFVENSPPSSNRTRSGTPRSIRRCSARRQRRRPPTGRPGAAAFPSESSSVSRGSSPGRPTRRRRRPSASCGASPAPRGEGAAAARFSFGETTRNERVVFRRRTRDDGQSRRAFRREHVVVVIRVGERPLLRIIPRLPSERKSRSGPTLRERDALGALRARRLVRPERRRHRLEREGRGARPRAGGGGSDDDPGRRSGGRSGAPGPRPLSRRRFLASVPPSRVRRPVFSPPLVLSSSSSSPSPPRLPRREGGVDTSHDGG